MGQHRNSAAISNTRQKLTKHQTILVEYLSDGAILSVSEIMIDYSIISCDRYLNNVLSLIMFKYADNTRYSEIGSSLEKI